jgi:CelD/BcsL family acetyltransferase involved in cellulose biosynthesis
MAVETLSRVLVTQPAELEALTPVWEDLLADSASNQPTLSPLWLRTWWQIFGPQQGRQLRVLVLRDGETCIGLAPLLRRRHWYRHAFPFRRLEFLASGERPEDSICSDYLNLVARRGHEQAVTEQVVSAIVDGTLGRWDEVVLSMMDGEHPLTALVSRAFRARGFTPEIKPTGVAPYIPLPATWEAYLASLPGRHRALVTRSLKDFEAWSAGDYRVLRATDAASLTEGKRILIELHRQRWGEDGEAGVFRSPHFLAFHDAILPQLLERGALQLLWMNARGQPLAAIYNMIWDSRVLYYQAGRRIDLPSKVRPGIVMMAHAIRESIAAGCREFDFLGGDARFKMQLALATRPLVEMRIARKSLIEWAYRSARFVYRRAKSITRRWAGSEPGCTMAE